MKINTPDTEIKNAIDILESLINSKTTNVFDTIRRYKEAQTMDSFTSYRLNKELKKLQSKI
ncbi:MAG: hypothetical protein PHE78_00340 [Candidatus Gastranaerophilales bacterium]|jgi:hypothetical protein|nr:hypothetical protein [Candidatus Gastranaerophilales bacterium]